MTGTALLLALLERGVLPDPLLRLGIRHFLKARLRAEDPGDETAREARLSALAEELSSGPIAPAPEAANRQHYELPTEFFRRVLGRRLKYSCGYWPPGVETLDQAEEAMLELTAARARVEDGQAILDLGCGWGSLALYLGERLPRATILAVTNSSTQAEFVAAEAARRSLANVAVERADVNRFQAGRPFDRVISIEMFEHVRNYQLLLERIASWLAPDGRLFVHLFCHRRLAYPFEVRDASDWMARHFFTGGLMPSADLLPRFRRSLVVEEQWAVDGRHYRRTCRAWLRNLTRQRAAIRPILESVYGRREARRWWIWWRVFFLACAECFGLRGGGEWQVAHYRLRRAQPSAPAAVSGSGASL